PRVRSHMQVSCDAEGRSKCVPRLHGPYCAPASRLAGQDSGELRAGHISCAVERDSPCYQHHSDSVNRWGTADSVLCTNLCPRSSNTCFSGTDMSSSAWLGSAIGSQSCPAYLTRLSRHPAHPRSWLVRAASSAIRSWVTTTSVEASSRSKHTVTRSADPICDSSFQVYTSRWGGSMSSNTPAIQTTVPSGNRLAIREAPPTRSSISAAGH